MENRYKIENGIIVGNDLSYTASEVYETDDNLQIFNENGVYLYKVISGNIIARTQSEIDADYLIIYKDKKLTELRELLYTSWPDSSKAIAALKENYDLSKSSIESATSISEIDTAYNNFVTFMDLS